METSEPDRHGGGVSGTHPPMSQEHTHGQRSLHPPVASTYTPLSRGATQTHMPNSNNNSKGN